MSTTTIAVDVVNDVAGDVTGEKEKPSRKFPLPCWTQGETLALIDAYRKRWYALRRGYLRTADWDAVAESVVSRFPGVLPAKTSAQCRHKMEKLRQRYRAEKQRSLSFPAGKFFSSWFFFENMDAMENGSEVGSGQDLGNLANSGNGIKPESFFDQNTMKLKLNNSKKFDHGVMLRNSSNIINGRKIPNFESEGRYMEPDSDKDEDEPGFETGLNPVIGLFASRGSEGKKYVRNLGDFKANNVLFNSLAGTNYESVNEYHTLKSSENEALLPPRLRVKRMERDVKDDDEFDDRFSARDMNSSIPSGIRGRYGRYVEPETAYYNGFTRTFGVGIGAEKKGSNGNTKRERNNPIEEMVSAIKMLGEGFVKMEKMKMEMAMEIEKNRMEMEMKRHELILQSQGQIVEAFTRGFIEMNKKMKMAVVLPES